MYTIKKLNLRFHFIILVTIAIFMAFPSRSAYAAPRAEASATSLMATVNDLRAANGLHTLRENVLLNISAQSHSQYQANLGYWTHSGPGGSNETDRAYGVGYGGGNTVACDEAVAVASSDKDAAYIVYTLWNDYVHRDVVLLNKKYIDIGAGVAKGADGLFYYTVNLCVISGETPNTTVQAPIQGTKQPLAPASTFSPLLTATPRENGSIWHVVQPGEYLFLIAVSYGKTELELATMNGISPANPLIYAGQELLIQGAPTATITPTITNTPRPPTRTLRPTFTPRPTRITSTPQNTPTLTLTPTELPAFLQKFNDINQRTWGWLILSISLVGAALSFAWKPRRINKPSALPDNQTEPEDMPTDNDLITEERDEHSETDTPRNEDQT